MIKYSLILFFFTTMPIEAQNTLSFREGDTSPPAQMEDVAWMEGHWKGKAFGGIVEEIWSPPLGGSMMFSFKLVIEQTVAFYELGHFRQKDETLIFELKHFNKDLTGWESKEEVQQFKLIKLEDDKVYFDGFTFERINEKEINIYAMIHNEDGTKEEVTFNYKKQ